MSGPVGISTFSFCIHPLTLHWYMGVNPFDVRSCDPYHPPPHLYFTIPLRICISDRVQLLDSGGHLPGDAGHIGATVPREQAGRALPAMKKP